MEGFKISYHFGQIKPEYRGDSVLFVERSSVNSLSFESFPMNSLELVRFTEGKNVWKRAYIGVNAEKAEKDVLERFERSISIPTLFYLDAQIVNSEDVFSLESCLERMIYGEERGVLSRPPLNV